MEAAVKNKTKWIHLRLAQGELKAVHDKFRKSTCRNLSHYCRTILLDRPIVATYRNRSQDDMVQQIATLNRELSAIGNNLNQVTKKMHTLQPSERQPWGSQFSGQAEAILLKIAEIKAVIQDLAEKWLR